MKYVPAWKDNSGNRFFVVAENHVFDTYEAAQQFQIADFIFYIPFGWTPRGIVEIEINKDGKGTIPHVSATGPYNFEVAVIEGPLFDAAMKESVEP